MAGSPRQNRVDPLGDLIADPARGAWMGNRGALHRPGGEIVRHHANRRWIYCRLEFRGRRRELMAPNRYTELFFLDEPTAFAAGHRPCAECQRERYNEFRSRWPDSGANARPVAADELDRRLHGERIGDDGERLTFAAELGELPDGVIFDPDRPQLLWRGRLRSWGPAGYTDREPVEPRRTVDVLTPLSTVHAFEAGFELEAAVPAS